MSAEKIEFQKDWNFRAGRVVLREGLPLFGRNGTNLEQVVVSTLNPAAAATYTVAQLLGGLILRDPNGGARTDVTPTAAALVAALGCEAGNAFRVTVRNTADANETITLSAGAGVTLSGTATIAQNNSKEFLFVCTNANEGEEAFTAYSLGTVVH